MPIKLMCISWHQIAYRRVYGKVTLYTPQKKDICHLSTIKRGHISDKGGPKEEISQITILLNKNEHCHFKKFNKLKIKSIGICIKYAQIAQHVNTSLAIFILTRPFMLLCTVDLV